MFQRTFFGAYFRRGIFSEVLLRFKFGGLYLEGLVFGILWYSNIARKITWNSIYSENSSQLHTTRVPFLSYTVCRNRFQIASVRYSVNARTIFVTFFVSFSTRAGVNMHSIHSFSVLFTRHTMDSKITLFHYPWSHNRS